MTVGRADTIIPAGRPRGFTLVELLVVIVIIAVIAAIAFPVFVKAKEYARISECLSNLQQTGRGLQMYLNDYEDHFPAAVPWATPEYCAAHGNQRTFQQLVGPYVRSKPIASTDGSFVSAGVFRCPSDKGMPATVEVLPFDIPPDEPIWKHTGSSYEYYAGNQKDYLSANSEQEPPVSWSGLSPEVKGRGGFERVGAPMSAVLHPTRKAVLGDIWFWHMGDEVPVERIRFRDTLFADGHAGRVRGMDHLEARVQQLRPGWHRFDEVDYEIVRLVEY